MERGLSKHNVEVFVKRPNPTSHFHCQEGEIKVNSVVWIPICAETTDNVCAQYPPGSGSDFPGASCGGVSFLKQFHPGVSDLKQEGRSGLSDPEVPDLPFLVHFTRTEVIPH
ncbi:MAG: hypothetical protein NTZ24_09905 [Deltaproteobacteria bacterium]|nr:hypothetical protein [Deltaproteobacteria bacterium]